MTAQATRRPVRFQLGAAAPERVSARGGWAAALAPLTLLLPLGSCDVATPGDAAPIDMVESDPDVKLWCRTNDDCSAAEVCCSTGNLGRCSPGDAECALPDLQLPADALNGDLFVDQLLVAPGFSSTIDQWSTANRGATRSCALEKQCVLDSGLYKLLRFSTQVVTVGAAELAFGAPGAPGVELAACDGQPYLKDFLYYELLDERGSRVADARGRGALSCQPARPDTPQFHCGFLGVAALGSLSYDARSDCQWLDIGKLQPGDYRLRITVNSDRAFLESNYDNNVLVLPVTLPALDPLAPCPTPPDPMVLSHSQLRDCGWAPIPTATCTPGEPVVFGCAPCEGDPMLRLCDGNAACTSDRAFSFAEGSDVARKCPTAHFTCPASGIYNGVVGVYDPLGAPRFVCAPHPLPTEAD